MFFVFILLQLVFLNTAIFIKDTNNKPQDHQRVTLLQADQNNQPLKLYNAPQQLIRINHDYQPKTNPQIASQTVVLPLHNNGNNIVDSKYQPAAQTGLYYTPVLPNPAFQYYYLNGKVLYHQPSSSASHQQPQNIYNQQQKLAQTYQGPRAESYQLYQQSLPLVQSANNGVFQPPKPYQIHPITKPIAGSELNQQKLEEAEESKSEEDESSSSNEEDVSSSNEEGENESNEEESNEYNPIDESEENDKRHFSNYHYENNDDDEENEEDDGERSESEDEDHENDNAKRGSSKIYKKPIYKKYKITKSMEDNLEGGESENVPIVDKQKFSMQKWYVSRRV